MQKPLDPTVFERFGLSAGQARALAHAITAHQAPSLHDLVFEAGLAEGQARMVAQQITHGIGKHVELAVAGFNLEFAKALAGAIDRHSPWRPSAAPRPTEEATAHG